jgi:hypothetical protein
MTITLKIQEATQNLETLRMLLPFDRRVQTAVFDNTKQLLQRISAHKDSNDDNKAREVDIVFAGTFIIALANQQRLNNEKYYYPKQYHELLAVGHVQQAIYALSENQDPLRHLVCQMIQNDIATLATGLSVMNGDLPFDADKLIELLPQADDTSNLTSQIKSIAQTINQEPRMYSRSFILIKQLTRTDIPCLRTQPSPAIIEDEFLELLKKASELPASTHKTALLEAFTHVKNTTIQNLEAGKKDFSFHACKALVSKLTILTNKIESNTLTQDNIDTFITETKPYKTCSRVAFALSCIVGAALAVLAALALTAALPATLISGAIGLGVFGGAYRYNEHKNNPLTQLSDVAQGMLPTA